MEETKALVLVAEDEEPIAGLERLYLSREGFDVHVERDGWGALTAAQALHPVAIVLDVGLPGLDGIEVYRALRREGDATPIVLVTADDAEVARVRRLGLVDDERIGKPFSPRELVARVTGLLRRVPDRSPHAGDVRTLGPVTVVETSRTVTVEGHGLALTATEFDLLAFLMRRPGRVYSRGQLLTAVWGHTTAASTRTVDVHVAQLRAKLGAASPIRTVRGVGYAAGSREAER